jgi:hypothetical protein
MENLFSGGPSSLIYFSKFFPMEKDGPKKYIEGKNKRNLLKYLREEAKD